MATKKRTTTKKAPSAKRTTKAAKETDAKQKKISQIGTAIRVLNTARKPMSCKEMVDATIKKGLWASSTRFSRYPGVRRSVKHQGAVLSCVRLD